MKSLRLGCAKREVWGSQEEMRTLGGASGISVSHFQITLCFSPANTETRAFRLDSGIIEGMITDPKEMKMTPCSASSTKVLRSSGRALAGVQPMRAECTV